SAASMSPLRGQPHVHAATVLPRARGGESLSWSARSLPLRRMFSKARYPGAMTETTPVRDAGPVRSTGPRQVRPRTEGWTQQKDASGRPLLQFAAPKRGMPPVHLADLTPEQRV